ncbi:hypothetical protein D3C76_748330 [compost metagenome]
MPPELSGIGTIAAILYTGLETRVGIGVSPLLHQQRAAAQQHPRAHGAGFGVPGRGQFLIKVLEQGFGTQQLATLLQQLHMAEGKYALKRQATVFARLLDAFAVDRLNLVEIALYQRLLGLQGVTEQALPPGTLGQFLDGLAQQPLGLLGLALMERQVAGQRFPLGYQFVLFALICLGQETLQPCSMYQSLVKPAGQHLCPGVEQYQARRTAEQRIGQFTAPLSDQRQAAPLQQAVPRVVLHQAGGHFRLLGLERVLQGVAHLILADGPLARLAVDCLGDQRREKRPEQWRDRWEHAQVLAIFTGRFDEQAAIGQPLQQLSALTHAQYQLAQ